MSAPLRVLVVDDEAPAVRRLQRLLEDSPQASCIGGARNGKEAIAQCERHHPDLVLLDVEMPGGDGVSVARSLCKLDRAPQIVFVTAFEHYAVDAFDVQALDYLVKPVRPERLEQALRRTRAALDSKLQRPPSLSARLGEKLIAIPLDDVRVLLAEDKYTTVHHLGGEALIEDSLLSLEQRYPERFVRVHRAALVSRPHLRSVYCDQSGHGRVEVDDCELQPEVSRRKLAAVRRFIRS